MVAFVVFNAAGYFWGTGGALLAIVVLVGWGVRLPSDDNSLPGLKPGD